MRPDDGDGVGGEVTRVDAVRYLQGSLGHAVASLALLFGAAAFSLLEQPAFAWLAVLGAALLSANALSIWAWDRLQAYFTPAPEEESEPTRSLTASPLSTESAVEMKAGAVMTLVFVAVLLLVGAALQYLDPVVVGVATAVCLATGNAVALVRALR